MKFKLVFESSGGGIVANHEAFEFGLRGVDRIRRELGVELPLDRIDNYVCYIGRSRVVVEIDEETARNSGLFQESAKITVDVPRYSLSRYVESVVESNKDSTTGEIKGARLVLTINKERLLEDWINAGYPEKWDIEQEDTEYD